MVYVRADGSVVQQRSWLRISIISDIFWGILDFIWLFISTLIYPKRPIHSKRPKKQENFGSSGSSGGAGGGGGPPPRRRGPNIHQLPQQCTSAGG